MLSDDDLKRIYQEQINNGFLIDLEAYGRAVEKLARNKALDDAAKVCEQGKEEGVQDYYTIACGDCAAGIRSLKVE